MKIKVEVTKKEEKEIEITLPYYYEQDLMSDYGDCYIYGKITEDAHYSINIGKYYGGKERVEIEIETHVKFDGLDCYLSPTECDVKKISEGKYSKMKNKAMKLLGKC